MSAKHGKICSLQVTFVLLLLAEGLVGACTGTCPSDYEKIGDKCVAKKATDAGPPLDTASTVGEDRLATRTTTAVGGADSPAGNAPRTPAAGISSNTSGVTAPQAGGTSGSNSGQAAAGTGNYAAGGMGAGAAAAPPSKPDDGPCAGHAEESFCDGMVMHHCAGNAASTAPETCKSAALCQAGVTSGRCAACIPGTFQCEGAKLNQCTRDGQYALSSECPSAALCNETAGACLDMKCVPSSVTCSSDATTLLTCNADGSDFAGQQPCGPAGCNQTLKMCNTCMPGAKSCSGNTLVTCSADGQNMAMTECAATGGECSTSSCRNNTCVAGVKPLSTACSAGKCDATGTCVACIVSQDCPDPGPCYTKTCTFGRCGMQPKAKGTACGAGMECDGSGKCSAQPCGNGVRDPGEACDPKADPGGTCTSACKWRNTQYAACTWSSPSGTNCPINAAQGWICAPNAVCSHTCDQDSDCKTESGYGSCLYFEGAGKNCAIECGSCPNGLSCKSWGPYTLCGQLRLLPDGGVGP